MSGPIFKLFLYKLLVVVFAGTICIDAFSQVNQYTDNLYAKNQWVDSVYRSLTPEQRIAQLIWPMAEQLGDSAKVRSLLDMVTKYQPGGVLLMKNKAGDIVEFVNKAQQTSRIPMLTAIDAEWGLAMRLDGVEPYPKAMMLGAITNDTLLYRLGYNMADQLKSIGITVNFGPVADVNCNPLNPVIGVRSFGENPKRVAKSAVMLMRGIQDNGVMAVAKHFPGHGDTRTDSHLALPLLPHSRQRFDSLELVSFAALVKNGVYGVMTAHLEVPGLELTVGVPSSLSKKVVTDLLKTQMGFSGLVITDAMNMKGVKKAGQPGRVDAMALMAGNDVVESSENIAMAIDEIKKAIGAGELSWSDIEWKCRKVLSMKYILGLDARPCLDNIDVAKINAKTDHALLQQLADGALTTLNWDLQSESVRASDSVAVLVMPHQKDWSMTLGNGLAVKTFELSAAMTSVQIGKLKKELKRYTRCVWIMDNSIAGKTIWNQAGLAQLRKDLVHNRSLVAVYNAMPYTMAKISGLTDVPNLVLCYDNTPYARAAVSKFLAGNLTSKGKLPVTVTPTLPEGIGFEVGYRR